MSGSLVIPVPWIRRFFASYPVLCSTILLFALVSITTLDVFVAVATFAFVVPVVLIIQCIIRWVSNLLRLPTNVRRVLMSLPAFLIAIGIFIESNAFGGAQRSALRVAIGGPIPESVRDIHFKDSTWTDTSIAACFHVDPRDFGKLLAYRVYDKTRRPDGLDIAKAFFGDVDGTNLDTDFFRTANVYYWCREESQSHCTIWADPTHSYVFLFYGAD